MYPGDRDRDEFRCGVHFWHGHGEFAIAISGDQ